MLRFILPVLLLTSFCRAVEPITFYDIEVRGLSSVRNTKEHKSIEMFFEKIPPIMAGDVFEYQGNQYIAYQMEVKILSSPNLYAIQADIPEEISFANSAFKMREKPTYWTVSADNKTIERRAAILPEATDKTENEREFSFYERLKREQDRKPELVEDEGGTAVSLKANHWSNDLTLPDRIIVGKFARFKYKGFGSCECCGRPWTICVGHDTFYKKFSEKEKQETFEQAGVTPLDISCFPLCNQCWEENSIEERLVYYRQLWKKHHEPSPEDWERIESAVKAGN